MRRLVTAAILATLALGGSGALAGCWLLGSSGPQLDGISDRSKVNLNKLVSSTAKSARKQWPDVKLAHMHVDGVGPDGTADLTKGKKSSIRIRFGSPSRAGRGDAKACIEYTITADNVSNSKTGCGKAAPGSKHPTLPTCGAAAIRKRATARGASADGLATLEYSVSPNFSSSNDWYQTGAWSLRAGNVRGFKTADTCADTSATAADKAPKLDGFDPIGYYDRAVDVAKRNYPGIRPRLKTLTVDGLNPDATVDLAGRTGNSVVYQFVGKDDSGACRAWHLIARNGMLRIRGRKANANCSQDLDAGGPICDLDEIRGRLQNDHEGFTVKGATANYRGGADDWIFSSSDGGSARLQDDCGQTAEKDSEPEPTGDSGDDDPNVRFDGHDVEVESDDGNVEFDL